jgi:hypothetical protein
MANFEGKYLKKEAPPVDGVWIFGFLLKREID